MLLGWSSAPEHTATSTWRTRPSCCRTRSTRRTGRSWTLFGLPGGIQLSVLLNVPIVVAVLVGLEQLATPTGRRLSLLLAASGIFAAVFHAAHLLSGDEAFRTPLSVLLLALTAVLSPLQLVAARGQHDALLAGR